MLEAVPARIYIGVTAKVREDKHRRPSLVLWVRFDRLPYLRAQSVRSPDALDVKRICPGVSDVDIVQCYPQQARRELTHQLTRNIDRELIRAGQTLRMRPEVVQRELENLCRPMNILIMHRRCRTRGG